MDRRRRVLQFAAVKVTVVIGVVMTMVPVSEQGSLNTSEVHNISWNLPSYYDYEQYSPGEEVCAHPRPNCAQPPYQ